MKPRLLSPARLSFRFAPALAALFAAPSAYSQTTRYWDQNGTTAGFGTGSGTWANPTVSRWSTSNAGTATPGASITTLINDPLHFGTDTTALAAGTITVSGTVDGASLRFGSSTTGNITLSGGTINLAAATSIHAGAGGTTVHTIASNLTGAATSLTRTSGTVALSGTNTYAGQTILNSGTTRFVNPGSLYNNVDTDWTAAKINVKSGATLAFNVGGAGQFTTGNVTTLLTNLAEGASATNGMNAGSNFGFDTTGVGTGNSFTIADVIADSTGANGGARGLTKLGTNTLVLGNANPYTGTTTVSAGTLVLATTGAVQNSSGITLAANAVTLQLSTDTAFTTLPAISGSTGTTGTTIVADRATAGEGLNHVLGTPILGANTFNFTKGPNVTGGTAGITFVAVNMSSGAAGTALLNPTTATLIITGGVTGTGSAVARTLNLGGTGTGHSIGGGISNGTSSPTSLTKSDTSTWVLTGDSTYTGTTTINAGILDLGGSTANGSLASPTLTLAGGTFAYTRTGTNTQSFTTTNINAAPAASLSVAAGNTLNLGTVTRGAGSGLDFSTTGAGIVAALASNNVGGIMPGFSFGNTFAVANGDGVAISGLSSYTLTSAAGTTAANYAGNNIDVDNSAGTLDAAITANSLRFNTAAATTVTLTGTPNVITSGGVLVGSGTGANPSTITGGELAGAAGKDLAVIQNNLLGGLTIASVIANNTAATGLTKSGAGLLTLAGANTYTGATAVTAGTLQLSGAGTPGAPGSPVSVSSGALLDLNGTSQNITFAAGAGLGTVANNSGGGTSILTLTGTPTINGSLVRIADSTTTPGGKVAVVIIANTQPMSNLNTYSGGTTVNGGAFLYLGASSVLGGGNSGPITLTAAGTGATGNAGSGLVVDSVTYANDISGAGYIHSNSNTANNVTFTGNLTNSGPYIWRGGAVANNTFSFAGNGTTSVLSGVIGSTTSQVNGAVATGNVIKSGTGTLTLAGANVYTGTTTINGGNLILSGAGVIRNNASNTITINNTGTLTMSRTDTWGNSASGIPVLPIVINAGGTLTTGGSFFNTLGALTLNGGTLTSTGGANANFGSWALRGTVTTGGTAASTISQSGTNANINLGANSVTNATFDVADATGNANVDLTVSAVLQDGKNDSNLAQASFLTKTGTGTMTLSGPNTYTGDTTVSAGTLELADNAQLRFVLGAASGTNNRLTGTGTATLDGDFVIDTAAAGALTSGSWTLVDNATLAETYTTNFSVAGFDDIGGNQWVKSNGPTLKYTFDEATGILTLAAAGPGTAFSSWITGTFAGGATVPSGKQGANDDPDNDGIRNLIEYAIASQDPTVPNPTIGTFTGTSLSFAKRADASGLAYAIQESTDVGLSDTWAEVTGAPPAYINDATAISHTFTPGTPAKDFFRLKVTQTAP